MFPLSFTIFVILQRLENIQNKESHMQSIDEEKEHHFLVTWKEGSLRLYGIYHDLFIVIPSQLYTYIHARKKFSG